MALVGFPAAIEVTLGASWLGKNGLSPGVVLTLTQVTGLEVWTEDGTNTPSATTNRLRFSPNSNNLSTGFVNITGAGAGVWSTPMGTVVAPMTAGYPFQAVWSANSWWIDAWGAGQGAGFLASTVTFNPGIFSSLTAGATGLRGTLVDGGVASAGAVSAQVTVSAVGADAGGMSSGLVRGAVDVTGVAADGAVASTGYVTNVGLLHAGIMEAGAASAGAGMMAAKVAGVINDAGAASVDSLVAWLSRPELAAVLTDNGTRSADSAVAALAIGGAGVGEGVFSRDSALGAVGVAAVLLEAGGASAGAGVLIVRSQRLAVIVDHGVVSRSGGGGSGGRSASIGVVGAVVGPEVPADLVIEEKHGRVLSDNSAELTYIIRHTDDDAVARQALLNFSPWSWRGKSREDAEVEEIGYQLWLGTVRYSVRQTRRQGNRSRFSFETRGGVQHITQSLETVGRYGPAGSGPAGSGAPGSGAPDFGGAIGVQAHGVEGTDITVPLYTFSAVHYFDQVSLGYKSTLFYLTGRVNDSPFQGLATGECLFLGAAGSTVSGDLDNDIWEITFAFAGSPNVTGLTIGPIRDVAKQGWEYLWVRYAEAEDTAAKMLIHKPLVAYVEKVYRQGNFAQLGIGT